MSRTAIAVISGIGGIFVGLFIADKYAQYKATSSTNSLLNLLHIGGAAPVVDPIVAGLVG